LTTLDVYLEACDRPVGELSTGPEGDISFRYVAERLPHPISLSLPLREAPYGDVESRGFFSNLLFENEMREQVMQKHGIAESDVVGLLRYLGADCPGSISCVPRGAPPGKRPGRLDADYDALDGSPILPPEAPMNRLTIEPLPVTPGSGLERLMRSLCDHRRMPLDSNDPSPLAGVQGKVALTRLPDGCLGLPQPGSGAPTTHILKVPRANAMDSVLREHFAMGLMARAQGHPVAITRVLGAGELQGLLVERFDRRITYLEVHRIHQEDFCQALGLGHRLKYERNGSGDRVFSAAAIGRLLRQLHVPAPARQAFFEITVANMVLGNSDNHGKNHALLYTEAKPVLAPAYDIAPVLLDDATHEMAFRLGAARLADDVTVEDLEAFLIAIGHRGLTRSQHNRVRKIVATLLGAVEEVPRPARKRLVDLVRQQAHHLFANPGLGLGVPEFDAVPINR
jgi:serine/threonine-protein kinase HipA